MDDGRLFLTMAPIEQPLGMAAMPVLRDAKNRLLVKVSGFLNSLVATPPDIETVNLGPGPKTKKPRSLSKSGF